MYDFVVGIMSFIMIIDDDKKTRAGRQNRVYWIVQAPILVKFRNWSCLEVEGEQLGEFLHAKRADSHCDELKQAMGKSPVCLVDLSQGAFICLVESLR